jgi:DNA polymerase-3 subunit beta
LQSEGRAITLPSRGNVASTERKTTMNIDMKLLKAVRFAASTEETRYYLQGVFVKTQGEYIVLVATDGHRMIVARHKRDEQDEDQYPNGVIIPPRLIDRIKIAKRRMNGNDDGVVTIEGDTITIRYAGDVFVDKLVDGTFPDYTRVIPKGWSNEVAQYNPAYLLDFVKAVKIVSDNSKPSITVHYNGLDPAVVNLNGGNIYDWFGVIMPIRGDRPFPDTEWAKAPKPQPDQDQAAA